MSANQTKEDPRHALGYEMWMLRAAQEQLTAWDNDGFKSSKPEELFHFVAVLDSFLVHARSLLYFFYPEGRPHRDDVLPGHFFVGTGVRWPHSRATIPCREESWIESISRTLQHLSVRRHRPRVNWDEREIRHALDALLDEFNALGPVGGTVVPIHPDHAN